MMNTDIFEFVSHKWNCDAIQPMWHKGPCDCGLYEMLDKLRSTGLSSAPKNREALGLLYSMYKISPDLMTDWAVSRKRGIPEKLYWCLKCGHPTAEKKPDIQGWDGSCHCCGAVAQGAVGELAFSRVGNDESVAKEPSHH